MRNSFAALAVSAALWTGLAAPAHAAVRICQAPVSSGLASDAIESRARAKALSSWTLKATSIANPAPNWRIAAQKQLRCAKIASGTYDCVAYAQPCKISQVPRPALPPLPAPRRGKVKDKPIST